MKMIFDVESNGLHGEGFAVGWVVINDQGEEILSGFEMAMPTKAIDAWVAENVMPHLPGPTKTQLWQVRDAFWQAWQAAKTQGATLWTDCGWPVETNFLSACVADNPEERSWSGPYPLHEIATVFDLKGLDPTAKHGRLENETAHHPTGDSRQSARLLHQCINN